MLTWESNTKLIQSEMFESKYNELEKPPALGGGPLGYGDPDDKRLRKAEKDIIIPKMMKEEASKRCSETLKLFLECAKQSGLLCIIKCRAENDANNKCLEGWYKNAEFVKEVTDKYLERRSYFRKTGEPLVKYERKKKSES